MIVVVQESGRTLHTHAPGASLPAPPRTTHVPPYTRTLDRRHRPDGIPSNPHLPQELLDRYADAQGPLAGLNMDDLFPVITATYYHKAAAWCFQAGQRLARLIVTSFAP